MYQWTLNHNKNYYLYGVGLSAFFAFVFKPIISAMGLFEMYKGIQYWHLFIGYLVVMTLSKLITNIFVHFQSEQEADSDEKYNLGSRFARRKAK